ncbi:MAG TPA: FAD-binding protein [Phycisphaerales bacterium]|nr:FAD-binding protein [Phycisphaerales bacterium]
METGAEVVWRAIDARCAGRYSGGLLCMRGERPGETGPTNVTSSMTSIAVQRHAPIPTWFGVGGGADALASPRTPAELDACLEIDPSARMLGDGANLLVDDGGVGGLVVKLAQGEFARVEPLPAGEGSGVAGTVTVRAGAGANLPKLIVEAVRMGLGGIEGLAGIPATVGGALVMNAGGSFGQIADVVRRVHATTREGDRLTLDRSEIAFAYRCSGLNRLIITGCELELRRADPAALRARLKDVMAYKKGTQPMAENSAGCCYKNPTLAAGIEGIGEPGARVSAGMLIDRAGCKGLAVGGAAVSHHHANFFTVRPGARAADVIALMGEVERRVLDRFGVALEREVVVWRREGA